MLSKSPLTRSLNVGRTPPQVIFIFCDHRTAENPATIQSRASVMIQENFNRTDCRAAYPICADERINVDPKALLLVGRKADGSMRDALAFSIRCIRIARTQ